MNINKIFNTFKQESNIEEQTLVDFKNHPLYKLKLFEKLINEQNKWKPIILKEFAGSEEGEILRKYLIYNRGWNLIKEFNSSNEIWIDALKSLPYENMNKALNKCINYFIEQEDYEKCAFLNKIKEIS